MSMTKMAWRNLSRRRLRTGLTVAGIAVGVALIFVLLSLVAGANTQVRASVEALGGADITVYNDTITGARQTFLLGSSATLNDSMVSQIAALPDVLSVSPQSTDVFLLDGTQIPVWGIDPQTYTATTSGLNIIDGRSLNSGDTLSVVVGAQLQRALSLSIGSTITVSARPPYENNTATLTVVGVYETGTTVLDRGIYVPRQLVLNLTETEGQVTSILVKASNPNDVAAVAAEISAQFPTVRVTTLSTIAAEAASLLNTLTLFFGVVGIVALIAGSFGAVNVMLISVFERTREIGTMKAIGAREGTVLRMFVLEAVITGFLGGIIGLAVGGGASFLVSGLPARFLPVGARLAPTLTLYDAGVSFLLGFAAGTIAGLYPAWRAARMKTVEALRSA